MSDEKPGEDRWFSKLIIRAIILFPLIVLVMLLAAGTIEYIQAWVLGGTMTVEKILEFSNKELMEERVKRGPGIKWWDKVFYAIHFPFYFSILVIAPLDAGRFQWSPQLPFYAYVLFYIGLIFSYSLSLWAMRVNQFFSSMVRIQTERGHKPIQDGPYGVIRHPGYLAGIIGGICFPLFLGSVWALIPSGIAIAALIVRTYLEDKTLQNELNGYLAYTQRVKYRLIPGVW